MQLILQILPLPNIGQIPYKMIYWWGINIGDWRFFRKFANIKIANINNYMDTTTKPLQKLKKKNMVAQIANIKSANCFLQTNSPNITLANKYSCTVESFAHHPNKLFLLQFSVTLCKIMDTEHFTCTYTCV